MNIPIPSTFLTFARDWHGGQNCMLYAVASTGEVRCGSIRPVNDNDEYMTDQEWIVHLWARLERDVRLVRKTMGESNADYNTAVAFETFCAETVRALRTYYGVEG